MPVMRGQTLRERLQAAGPLSIGETMRVAVGVADALAYAHRQGIVHRDIKPENILLHEGHAIVADFGIGKALAAAREPGTLTQVGMMKCYERRRPASIVVPAYARTVGSLLRGDHCVRLDDGGFQCNRNCSNPSRNTSVVWSGCSGLLAESASNIVLGHAPS